MDNDEEWTWLPEALRARARDKRCRIEALFDRKFPCPGDPDGTKGTLVAEALATFPEADRPFYAAVAAMTYDEYQELVGAKKAGPAGGPDARPT